MSRKRPYTLKQRAISQDETRQKIVEAAMELHQELGPRATSISAIAERAGVQRLTVYRHFPTEEDVFMACSAHWMSLNPPPVAELWAGETDGHERARIALAAFCAYYSRTQAMLTRVFDDANDLPSLQRPMAAMLDHLDAMAADIASGFGPGRPPKGLLATIRHAIAFPAWLDLERQGLSDRDKVQLILSWISGVVRSRR